MFFEGWFVGYDFVKDMNVL